MTDVVRSCSKTPQNQYRAPEYEIQSFQPCSKPPPFLYRDRGGCSSHPYTVPTSHVADAGKEAANPGPTSALTSYWPPRTTGHSRHACVPMASETCTFRPEDAQAHKVSEERDMEDAELWLEPGSWLPSQRFLLKDACILGWTWVPHGQKLLSHRQEHPQLQSAHTRVSQRHFQIHQHLMTLGCLWVFKTATILVASFFLIVEKYIWHRIYHLDHLSCTIHWHQYIHITIQLSSLSTLNKLYLPSVIILHFLFLHGLW